MFTRRFLSTMKRDIAILWDLDGTLMDTETIGVDITKKILEQLRPGASVMEESFVMSFLSIPAPRRFEIISKHQQVEDLITPEDFSNRYLDMMIPASATAPLLPGSMRILKYFHDNKIKQAVATSSRRVLLEIKQQNNPDLFQYFDAVISGHDKEIQHPKPSPDIFLHTASVLQVDPKNCIVFEDSINGIKAGLAAGMKVVAIPSKPIPKENLKGCCQVLNTLNDFDGTMFDLPPM
ncbi:hypothetical protein WA158_001449 [Blastocystis sp. Blastoise]